MRTVGIKKLKDRLSEYIRLAKSGETVLVTDRDRVVAELIAPREGRARAVDDAELAELLRTGMVAPPLTVSPDPPPRQPVMPVDRILADLAGDRGER